MTSFTRSTVLRGIEALSRLYPSWRLCQMVANVAGLAAGDPTADIATVGDEDFLRALLGSIRQRELRLEGRPPAPTDDDSLPSRVVRIVGALRELGEAQPESSFVRLVASVAEQSREFANANFADVEDADFARAIESEAGQLTGAA